MTYAEAKKYGDVQGVIKGKYAELFEYTDYAMYGRTQQNKVRPDKLFSFQKRYVDWFAEHMSELAFEHPYTEVVKDSEVIYDTAVADANGNFTRKYGVSLVTDAWYSKDVPVVDERDKIGTDLQYVPVFLQSVGMAIIDFVIRDEVYGKGEILKSIGAVDLYHGIIDKTTDGGKLSLVNLVNSNFIAVDKMLFDNVTTSDDRLQPDTTTFGKTTTSEKRLKLLKGIYEMYTDGKPFMVRRDAFEWYPMFDTTELEAEYNAARSEVDKIKNLMLASGAASLI